MEGGGATAHSKDRGQASESDPRAGGDIVEPDGAEEAEEAEGAGETEKGKPLAAFRAWTDNVAQAMEMLAGQIVSIEARLRALEESLAPECPGCHGRVHRTVRAGWQVKNMKHRDSSGARKKYMVCSGCGHIYGDA